MKKQVGEGEHASVKACTLCGQCNPSSVGWRFTKDERAAPRHAAWQCKRALEGESLYQYILNGRAETFCPLHILLDEAVIDGRKKLVGKGVETMANQRMIEKLRAGKNPYK